MTNTAYGRPFQIHDGAAALLEPIPLGGSHYNEDYIRNLAFEHPAALPIHEIDGSYRGAVPVCTEIATLAGPIDALFVNKDGRIVIMEAKLWRNPEARRKVVAQILDYAKEFSGWDYDDLQRAVSVRTGRKGNALYDIVKEAHPELVESAFVDSVSLSLERGRFLLMIIGDGIREGAAAITNFIERVGTLEFTFGLVEVSLFAAKDGSIFVQPRVLARTEIINRSIVVLRQGRLELDNQMETGGEPMEEAEESEKEKWNRTFFKEFLTGLKLDDPEQPIPPKPTGFPNVAFPMPPSGTEVDVIAVLKNDSIAEVYFRLRKGNLAERLSAELRLEQDTIEQELGLPVALEPDKNGNFSARSAQKFGDAKDPAIREAIKAFLSLAVNRYVNVFRPRLARLSKSQRP